MNRRKSLTNVADGLLIIIYKIVISKKDYFMLKRFYSKGKIKAEYYRLLDDMLLIISQNEGEISVLGMMIEDTKLKQFGKFKVESALNKLVLDKYITKTGAFSDQSEPSVYFLTFEGHLLIESGGYVAKVLKEKSLSKQIHFIQIVIAISTFIAALYYIMEICIKLSSR